MSVENPDISHIPIAVKRVGRTVYVGVLAAVKT